MVNIWTLAEETQKSADAGVICLIREVSLKLAAKTLIAASPTPPDNPTCYLEVVWEWCTNNPKRFNFMAFVGLLI